MDAETKVIYDRAKAAIIHPDYMFGRRTWYGSIRIVHQDSSSPSGRIAAAGCSPEMFSQIQAELGAAKSVQPEVQLGE